MSEPNFYSIRDDNTRGHIRDCDYLNRKKKDERFWARDNEKRPTEYSREFYDFGYVLEATIFKYDGQWTVMATVDEVEVLPPFVYESTDPYRVAGWFRDWHASLTKQDIEDTLNEVDGFEQDALF